MWYVGKLVMCTNIGMRMSVCECRTVSQNVAAKDNHEKEEPCKAHFEEKQDRISSAVTGSSKICNFLCE